MEKIRAIKEEAATDRRRRMSQGTMRMRTTQEEQDIKEEKVYRRWLSWRIAAAGGSVDETLETAFADGSVLCWMLKTFASIDYPVRKARQHLQQLDQLSRMLELFKGAGWPVSVESKQLLGPEGAGHRRAILGWIWQIINTDQMALYGQRVKHAGDSVPDIYRWVDGYLADHYPDVDRGDALKGLMAFQDGKLLSYLVHRTDPNAIDLSGVKHDPVDDVTNRAIKAAAENLGVPPLIESDDVIEAQDDRSLITYLMAFRDTVERRDKSLYKWVEDYLDDQYPDITPGYPLQGVDAFKDGRLLDYLLHKEHPEAIDLDAQRELPVKDRIDSATSKAGQALGFQPKLRGGDLEGRGDERKLKQYLREVREALEGADAADLEREAAEAAEREKQQRERELAAQLAAEEEERRRRQAEERRLKEEEDERRRKAEEERRRQREEDDRRRREAAEAEEAERKRKEDEERRRREAEAAAEAERRRREDEERRRREAEAAAEAERRRREDEERRRREAEEEEERRRREAEAEANAIKQVRNVWQQRILCIELKELQIREAFDAEADARNSRMYGPGLEYAQVMKPAAFTIETRNRNGELVRVGGHPFKLRVTGPNGQDPEIQSIVDNNDGTFSAKYVPTVAGPHTVTVTLRGENVAQSPVYINVTDPNPPPAPRTVEAAVEDDLDDLRRLLEAITREIARDKRNLSKLPEVTRKVEQIGLKDETARKLGRELREEDNPRLKDFLGGISGKRDRAADLLDDPKLPKSQIRKQVAPLLSNLVKDMDDWADDYKGVMDKVNNLRPKKTSGGQKRQRIHIWIHRHGNPIPQHIMVTTNKPSEMAYRRHIRIDATQGYDTHADPSSYLQGLLGLTGELKFQKIDSRDRYLTGGHDDSDISFIEEGDANDKDEPYIVNAQGTRIFVSREPLMLEGALQNERGQQVYCFLYSDKLVITSMVNNGEKYVLKSEVKFDDEARVMPNFQGSDKAFLVRGRNKKEKVFNAKSKKVASIWCSNIESLVRKAF